MPSPSVKGVAGDHAGDDPWAEGRVYPSTVEYWPDDDGPWKVTLDWQVADGRVECMRVEVEALDPTRPVTEGTLRDLKIGERIRRGRASVTGVAQAAQTAGARPSGMRKSTWERLQKAAEVYRSAYRRGEAPARAVADHFGLSPGGASSLVARARDAGLLPPTSPGAPQA